MSNGQSVPLEVGATYLTRGYRSPVNGELHQRKATIVAKINHPKYPWVVVVWDGMLEWDHVTSVTNEGRNQSNGDESMHDLVQRITQ